MNIMMPCDIPMMNRTNGIALSILACLAFNVGCAGDESAERSTGLTRNRAILEEGMQPHVVPSVAFVVPSMGQVGLNTQTPDSSASRKLIHIQPGDSLWKLAHKYAKIKNELKRINGLSTDVVQAEQRLTLSLPISTGTSP